MRVTHKNYIHEEIKEKIEDQECLLPLSSEPFVFSLLCRNIKIILSVVLCGRETCSNNKITHRPLIVPLTAKRLRRPTGPRVGVRESEI
jgi:hypothetical protein